ncbi:dicarboxylate/amino acid:cation symporter [Tautonia plasticadhaerens]|uniref:Proton glutamate symport protein n=1 Tax=Tautonia plasticadhaerens TaxID=2527974 RepID=A0A518GVR8_9BACT|nr:dicarboxylate/amino acid:cation symporter [Tautonia plasticadhaerens]QDV32694.1 Proton glutamate symport protein [Tautonia plasticadhaerens]
MDQADTPPGRRVSFVTCILLAMAAGALLGQFAHAAIGPDPTLAERLAGRLPGSIGPGVLHAWQSLGRFTATLGYLGSLVVDLIKGLAGPLLFFAVVDAFLRTRVRGRNAALMLGISGINAAIAVVIGLTLSNVIRPGRFLRQSAGLGGQGDAADLERFAVGSRPLDFLRDLLGFVPTNPVQPFLESSILSIVILAVLGGMALRRVKDDQIRDGLEQYRGVEDAVAVLYRAIEVALSWVIALVPLAVFGVVARTVAEQGFEPFLGLFAYVGVAVLGLAIQVGIVYQAWVILAARMSVRQFWSGAKEAVAYALGASSSLATLPVTLRCLDRMGASPTAARLSACVGTNFNNDGILLYEAMAVLFVAQAYGLDLSIGQQLVAALSCVVAGIGIAGVPEAGLISLALVLSTVGLPLELLPLLLTVDWALSRCRAMTNVVADILVAVLLDRIGVESEEPATLDTSTAPPESARLVGRPPATPGGDRP